MALILFDLNGTLLDPGPHRETMQAAARLAMIHTLADDFRPFTELIKASGGEPPKEMPPFPDVRAGLTALAGRGHRLAVLTNSSRETAERHLQRSGLHDRFERVLGSDQIGAYKPDGRAYAYALDECGAAAADSWLVAAHDWDVIGARGAGLLTAYLRRGGPGPVTITVDREGDTLASLDL